MNKEENKANQEPHNPVVIFSANAENEVLQEWRGILQDAYNRTKPVWCYQSWSFTKILKDFVDLNNLGVSVIYDEWSNYTSIDFTHLAVLLEALDKAELLYKERLKRW